MEQLLNVTKPCLVAFAANGIQPLAVLCHRSIRRTVNTPPLSGWRSATVGDSAYLEWLDPNYRSSDNLPVDSGLPPDCTGDELLNNATIRREGERSRVAEIHRDTLITKSTSTTGSRGNAWSKDKTTTRQFACLWHFSTHCRHRLPSEHCPIRQQQMRSSACRPGKNHQDNGVEDSQNMNTVVQSATYALDWFPEHIGSPLGSRCAGRCRCR